MAAEVVSPDPLTRDALIGLAYFALYSAALGAYMPEAEAAWARGVLDGEQRTGMMILREVILQTTGKDLR